MKPVSSEGWRFMLTRYLPLLAAASLAWEIAHIPLYTIGQHGERSEQVFAVLHCTAGDIMIGAFSLVLAVVLLGRRIWPRGRHAAVLGAATLFGMIYTIFSEWLNAEVMLSWQYSITMPLVPPFGTGLAPLLQWMIVPPVAYGIACALHRHALAAHTPRAATARTTDSEGAR